MMDDLYDMTDGELRDEVRRLRLVIGRNEAIHAATVRDLGALRVESEARTAMVSDLERLVMDATRGRL